MSKWLACSAAISLIACAIKLNAFTAPVRCQSDRQCPSERSHCAPIGECFASLDTSAPNLLTISATSATALKLVFDEPMAPTVELAAFKITPELSVLAVQWSSDGQALELQTDSQVAQHTYEVQVLATDTQGNPLASDRAPFVGFGLGPDLSPPDLVLPGDVALLRSYDALLTWTPRRGASRYFVDVATDPGFAQPIVGSPFSTSDIQQDVTLNDEVTYYWRVTSDVSDPSMAAAVRSFDVVVEHIHVYCPGDEACDGKDGQGVSKLETGSRTHPFSRPSVAISVADLYGIREVKVAARPPGLAYEDVLQFIDRATPLHVTGGFDPSFAESERDPVVHDTLINSAPPGLTVSKQHRADLTLSGLHQRVATALVVGVTIADSDALTIADSWFECVGDPQTFFQVLGPVGLGPHLQNVRITATGSHVRALQVTTATVDATELTVALTGAALGQPRTVELTEGAHLVCADCTLSLTAPYDDSSVVSVIDSQLSIVGSTLSTFGTLANRLQLIDAFNSNITISDTVLNTGPCANDGGAIKLQANSTLTATDLTANLGCSNAYSGNLLSLDSSQATLNAVTVNAAVASGARLIQATAAVLNLNQPNFQLTGGPGLWVVQALTGSTLSLTGGRLAATALGDTVAVQLGQSTAQITGTVFDVQSTNTLGGALALHVVDSALTLERVKAVSQGGLLARALLITGASQALVRNSLLVAGDAAEESAALAIASDGLQPLRSLTLVGSTLVGGVGDSPAHSNALVIANGRTVITNNVFHVLSGTGHCVSEVAGAAAYPDGSSLQNNAFVDCAVAYDDNVAGVTTPRVDESDLTTMNGVARDDGACGGAPPCQTSRVGGNRVLSLPGASFFTSLLNLLASAALLDVGLRPLPLTAPNDIRSAGKNATGLDCGTLEADATSDGACGGTLVDYSGVTLRGPNFTPGALEID